MIPKFRAWSKKFKRMYEVNLIDYENGDVGLKDEHGGVAIGDIKQLILMQSTGMFDKNDVEIFEGDIVHAYDECGSSLVGEVIYCDNAYCLKDNGGICNNLWINAEKYEVIGSIYQNSYLLESVDE